MSVYKLIKISILLTTVFLVACSPDMSDSKSSQVEIIPAKANSIPVDGLRVYIDPKTGGYLDSAPTGSSATTTANNVAEATPAENKYSAPKDSIVPGGGSYIELKNPPLKGKVFNQNSQ